ncbi:L-glutamate gamma-semialdehyde dehydrogenase [Candidatus Woesearchaeota archaeon CG11_big_fil_rev_8_21_14_0_20_43_8]|nr:MAG: L-glutamate gamma-semialdehyde dehydrogenase [Candidatus Woesearchaeota archaeon CG11_big_fil_rev_8_21_14_0_20_43_8]PIO09061.1 MAG: L-glutamate gamma-semialdehyde dehydrogenase [Candidatus Woesearchaeota archaeon CG08_land_8_20_14_0_20_43_7]
MIPIFQNCKLTDFSDNNNRQAMYNALEKTRATFGKMYPLTIGGERIESGDFLVSFNPGDKNMIVGMVSQADPNLAHRAIDSAWGAFHQWKKIPAEGRAEYLLKAAAIMKERRFTLAAMMVYEAGKSWVEADADVAEAIDFLEFYAREAIRWSANRPLTQVPGETNELVYLPLGAGVVISPWNFPCAILVGMTAGAIAAGNTIILKPASETPIIGAMFADIMAEAGLPPGVLNFVPGSGQIVGEYLVNSPHIRFISFTGSKQVGLSIAEKANKNHEGQRWIKRVTAEMGGKDAIIVDNECDLDAAAKGVMLSAFGYQGQKCSACSRVIVVREVYEDFIARLVEKTKNITIGPMDNPAHYLGPVINKAAYDKIMSYIEIGKTEGKLIIGGVGDENKGYYIYPTIFRDVPWNSRLAQEEIFGPVLSIIFAENFDDALNIANSTVYGLTGAVYTNNEEKIKKAKDEFYVGNLYFNRKCTGALVDVQPFGGFNLSGTDGKAGGREYLLLFMQAKSICRKN